MIGSQNNYYDFIVVGSGLAGLYTAYLIKKRDPHKTILILEKEKKEWIGGRAGNEMFYGQRIVTGAGVVRKKKDTLLVKLLKELHVPMEESTVKIHYSKTVHNVVNIEKMIEFLRKEYGKMEYNKGIKKMTFKQFALEYLPKEVYKDFTICAGYTDYENEDIYDVLYNYGMDDNTSGWKVLYISWKQLVERLVHFIGFKNIKSLQNVTEIRKVPEENSTHVSLFQTITEKGVKYYSEKVILATTITSVQQLLPQFSIYKQIKGQPFLRVYAKFTKESAKIMEQVVLGKTFVPGSLHQVIPYGNGIYMIAYTDNHGAVALKNYIQNTKSNRIFFERLVEKTLGIQEETLQIIAIKSFYWTIGTHYYTPLHGFPNRESFIQEAQHPMKDVFVVGEMVSIHQGWVEGALESVHKVIHYITSHS